MARSPKILQQMEANPRADWKIRDIAVICRHHGLECDPPTGGGSHDQLSSPWLEGIFTIPSNRPIKPVDIRKFTSYLAAHLDIAKERGK